MSTLQQELSDIFGEYDVLYLDPRITQFSQPAAPTKGQRFYLLLSKLLKRKLPKTTSKVQSILGKVTAICKTELKLDLKTQTADDIQEKLITAKRRGRLKIAKKLLELENAVPLMQQKDSVSGLQQEANELLRRQVDKTSIDDILLVVDCMLNRVDRLPRRTQERIRIPANEGYDIGYVISDWPFYLSESHDSIVGLWADLMALDQAARESRIVNAGCYPCVKVFGTYEVRLDGFPYIYPLAILFKQVPLPEEVYALLLSGNQRNDLKTLTETINKEYDAFHNRKERPGVDTCGYYSKDVEFLKPLFLIVLCDCLKILDWRTIGVDVLNAYREALRTLSGELGQTPSKIRVLQQYLATSRPLLPSPL